MKKTDLSNKPTEKLQSELKTIKVLTGALIGSLFVLFAAAIYGLLNIENKLIFIALIAVTISLSAILPLQFSSMKKIRTHLNTRKEND
jgi:hypothetical protein